MSNKEIYQKTLGFSVRRFFYDLLAFVVLAGACALGFFIAEKSFDLGLVGLLIGLVVGIVVIAVFLRYVSYTYKAGQIAMMTEGITTGSLPDDVIGGGKAAVKSRFATVAIYFAATGIIKGIFNQIGRGITAIGSSVGGDTGETVGSVISAVVQTIVAYLCDCCLGWVFFRKGVNAGKATCEGAVLFFKHGKTFAKNMGRVFGMGIASFLVIGGAFTGIFYVIGGFFTEQFARLSEELVQISNEIEGGLPAVLQDPATLRIVAAALIAVILWSILHSVFVRPFVLTGVLRNYLESGIKDMPTEESFALLDSKSAKFKKLHDGLA